MGCTFAAFAPASSSLARAWRPQRARPLEHMLHMFVHRSLVMSSSHWECGHAQSRRQEMRTSAKRHRSHRLCTVQAHTWPCVPRRRSSPNRVLETRRLCTVVVASSAIPTLRGVDHMGRTHPVGTHPAGQPEHPSVVSSGGHGIHELHRMTRVASVAVSAANPGSHLVGARPLESSPRNTQHGVDGETGRPGGRSFKAEGRAVPAGH